MEAFHNLSLMRVHTLCLRYAMQVHPNPDPNFKAEDFFETSALLITFISIGRYLEAAAKGRTSRVRCSLHEWPGRPWAQTSRPRRQAGQPIGEDASAAHIIAIGKP